ncbi:DUF2076 domain-containing protein [Ancylobacter sp. Lp-2]|uniref:DUF2076 domain-containing protein n=1 Tax=Ancylobacter sp. Lp-2 TaxID=2881339 RepID=UPI001E545FF0|nr:DUF2076 domain-containing protein [Ancylobacter sp. Lp-2]MCB4769874.1 DUF2076 domain-containing protein [Ancylobacter sp. Lp-2]
MNEQDRQTIQGLFARLAEVERNAAPRDAGAEGFIGQEIARQPGAPYYMAQTIVMQDYAMQQAQSRIAELEQRNAELEEAQASRPASGGGFLGGLFGSSQAPAPRGGSVPSVPRSPANTQQPPYGSQPYGAPQAPAGSPWGGQQGMGQQGIPPQGMAPGAMGRGGFGGGGFLAGAAQTAMGVAGGVLLGNAIAGMFGGNEAHAAPATPPAETPAADTSAADNSAADNAPADDPSPADDLGASDGGGFFDDFFGGSDEI